jgi:hypothetical protein
MSADAKLPMFLFFDESKVGTAYVWTILRRLTGGYSAKADKMEIDCRGVNSERLNQLHTCGGFQCEIKL